MGRFAAVWGIAGVAAVLLFPVVRLAPYAGEALASGLTAWQWTVLILNSLFMAYSEGYRGFQLKFCPRVVSRALDLYRRPTLLDTLLAPLFCIGYYRSNRRTIVVAWIGTIAIIALVLLVHRLNQPWRGIIDAGVVLGLTWGLVSLATHTFRAFRHRREP